MGHHIRAVNHQFILYSVLCILFSVLVGCDNLPFLSSKKPTPQKTESAAPVQIKGTLIAKINNMPFTLEDLNSEIEIYNSMVPSDKPELKITTREQKIDYLKNEVVRRILLYQEAVKRGLDRKEEIQKTLEKTKIDLLVVEFIREETAKVDISAKEIEDYYEAYKEELREPEERHVREIVVSTEREARDILIQLLQGGSFATLAKEYSRAPSAKDGGDLGFIPQGKKFSQFDTVAFSNTLEVGSISNIFKGPEGYYILKLEAKRGGEQKSLSEMWDEIKRALTFLKQQQRVNELINRLSREAKLEIYEGEIR